MSEHTKGPLRVVDSTDLDSGDTATDGVRVAKCWSSSFAPPRREAAANAARLALCWNQHDALVVKAQLAEAATEALCRMAALAKELAAALAVVLPMADLASDYLPAEGAEEIAKARAVLAKVPKGD